MASLINDPNGRRRIQFANADGERKTLRLGKIDRKSAEAIARHVEALHSANLGGQPLRPDTSAWLASIGENLRDKLAAVGLIEATKRLTVAEFLNQWHVGKKSAGHKPTSLRAWRQTVDGIITQFGERTLTSLAHIDGEAFRGTMQGRNLRATTIHKRLGHARQMLEDAVRLGHISVNPWRHVRQRGGDPSERRAYVPIADAERVIEYCPTIHWRLLVALARFGGLRVPSEAFSLTWGDVDWERGRLSVPSPKTEHLGKSHRVIPLFPMLRPHLEQAFEQAEAGTVYVFPDDWRARSLGDDGWGGANVRTTFVKIVQHAGVDPWPRIWHSLRASCESDLAQSFPLATVTKWLGNTPSVALRHYVDPTESAFDIAKEWKPNEKSGAKSGAFGAQNEAQRVTAGIGTDSHNQSKSVEDIGLVPKPAIHCDIVNKSTRECMGIEPTWSFVQTPRWF